jgi:hypothetical protein
VSKQTSSPYQQSFGSAKIEANLKATPDRFERSDTTQKNSSQKNEHDSSFLSHSPRSSAPFGWWKELEQSADSKNCIKPSLVFKGELPESFLRLLGTYGQAEAGTKCK